MLSHLDLFSGIGGFSLGLESAGVAKTVAFCDFDDYCQQVLKKNFPTVPIYNDVKELNYERLKADGINTIDIITGGYPCQPFSVAGRKKGEQDPRHVWPEMFRLIQELRPTWVIGENVGGHIKLGLDTVLENLESEGYSARTFSISASSIGANHKRERVWIMANSERLGRTEGTQESKEFEGKESSDQSDKRSERLTESRARKDVANSDVSSCSSRESRRAARGVSSESERLLRQESKGKTRQESRDSSSHVADTESIKSWEQTEWEGRKNSSGGSSNSRGHSQKRTKDVADSNSEGPQGHGTEPELRKNFQEGQTSGQGNVADTESSDWNGYETDGEHGETETQEIFGDGSSVSRIGSWWEFEPDVGRVAHGVPKRVDRLKCLGNSVVPQIPYVLGLTIKKILENE
jgi:DNA-cytosine methyltransferase